MNKESLTQSASYVAKQVAALTQQRSTAERTIESTYGHRLERAQSDRSRAEKAAHATYEQRTGDDNAVFEAETASAQETRDSAIRNVERTQASERSQMESRLENSRDKLTEREREARWLAETVYDAELAAAKGERASSKDRLERARKQVETAQESVLTWCEDYPVVHRKHASAIFRGAERVEGERVVIDDAIAEVEAVSRTLFQARSPKLASLSSLAVSMVLLGAAFGGIGFVLSGSPGIEMLIAACVGLVGAVVGWSRFRSAGRKVATEALTRIAVLLRSIETGIEQDDAEALKRYEEGKAVAKQKRKDELETHMTGVVSDRERAESEAKTRAVEIQDEFEPKIRAARSRFDADTKHARSELERKLREAASERDAALREIEIAHDRSIAEAKEERDTSWRELESLWTDGMALVAKRLDRFSGLAQSWRAWDSASWDAWMPSAVRDTRAELVARVGTVRLDRTSLPGGVEQDDSLRTRVPAEFEMPIASDVQHLGSIMIEHAGEPGAADRAVAAAQSVMLRLLTEIPAGKLRFTLIDPVALGQSFAGFMHLADYSELLVTHRIWTDSKHIDERLGDLTEHMENVIQKYLRNEFESIDAYNEQAGEIAEPYRYLVVADFPVNMEESSARRLSSIVSSGARCGVHTVIVRDTREPLPKGIQEDDLRRGSITLQWNPKLSESGGYQLRIGEDADALEGLAVELDTPPDDARVTALVQRVGEAAIDASRVEVPFAVVRPDESNVWTRSASTDVRVPLGRSGATKLQELSLGRGTAQHALIAGKTGSGKSTLLHVLVTNLALWYSPDEVEFYLVDFKKGVEFKAYANTRIPHARAVAIESDREFGLSVLQRVDDELKRRGDLFRDAGVQNVQGFRESVPDQPMPRVLLIIDEFQELFVEDDKLSQDAALLLDRLVRQGRAFGIHLVLGSQTLGGAYGLARSTLNQMAVRVALQCSEADSYLILSEDNAAARLLTRPGEAIYNDDAGRIEGNSPFQIVWLPDTERDTGLRQVSERTQREGGYDDRHTIVFEGNAPARLEHNTLLTTVWRQESAGYTSLTGWVGEAISIKDPTQVSLVRQSGSNVLMVGQSAELGRGVLSALLTGFAASLSRTGGIAYVADGTPDDDPGASELARVCAELSSRDLGADVRKLNYRDVDQVVVDLASEVERRLKDGDADEPSVVLVISGLQRFRSLRTSDDFGFSMDDDAGAQKPDKALASIVRDGPAVGVHAVVWADTVSNVERTLERQALREFEQRILFQMSATDSTALIDLPLAAKLGPNRGLLYSEESGVAEKFRPYAMPDKLVQVMSGHRIEADTGSVSD